MKRLTIVLWPLMILLLLVMASCGGSGSASPTVDPNLIYTQIWETVQINQTETAQAAPPAPISTDTPAASPTAEPTNTPLVSNTPLANVPTATALVLNTPSGPTQAPRDNASWVADITIPDGYVAFPGEMIDKVWEIKNLGPSTWDVDYYIKPAWGGEGTDWMWNFGVTVGTTVLPGETVKLVVKLKAPETPGNYSAYFRMVNDQGYPFGDPVTIVITVK